MRRQSTVFVPRPRRARRGFTFVELCLGLLVTTLVMAAVASFALAAAQSWKHSEQTNSAVIRARQAAIRITRIVQNCELIGAVGEPVTVGEDPATVILWVQDTNHDGLIQAAECGMLERDPDERVLKFYPPGQGDAVTPLPWLIFSTTGILVNFKVGRDSQPIARNVDEACFKVYSPSDASRSPSLEFKLTVSDETCSVVEYGACTVRAPAKQPL